MPPGNALNGCQAQRSHFDGSRVCKHICEDQNMQLVAFDLPAHRLKPEGTGELIEQSPVLMGLSIFRTGQIARDFKIVAIQMTNKSANNHAPDRVASKLPGDEADLNPL